MQLLQQNSPEDYVLRGFSREDILTFTGTDVGYHGNSMKRQLNGIDRFAYKVLYIKNYYDEKYISDVLQQYANGLDKESVLNLLGVSGSRVKLKSLFTELGFADAFKDADKRQRLSSMSNGMVAKYGTDNPFKLSEFQEKAANTREVRYGGRYTFSSDSCLSDGARKTFSEHMADDEFHKNVVNKRNNTNKERYGSECVMNNPEIQQKVKDTCIERYGVDHAMKTTGSREKFRETSIERYGVSHYSQTQKARDLMSERMCNPVVQKSICEVKLANGSFNTSQPEDVLYSLLVERFGEDDVKRQYMSDLYKYQCDFYIVSRDMYIELNASWTHGGHWYDNDSECDNSVVDTWRKKSTKYYDNAIRTWTSRDVMKRHVAKQQQLNYIVFWDNKLSDVMLWFGMDCPDGHDYDKIYSWLPNRDVCASFDYPDKLNNTDRSVVAAVKAANGSIFYNNECKLWNENPLMCHFGTLQSRLYANRYQYLGKLPVELSDAEIFRGLSISGLYHGYSVFNNTGMNYLIKKYDVKSIYDPCAGWGERLLTACLNHVRYLGCDINSDLQVGYQDLINHYHLQDCNVVCDDSSKLDMREHAHDCVFTCPPYENTEMYTDIGAENLLHDDFLNWWRQVVEHSISDETVIFAYQINTRYADSMNQVLFDLDWHLQEKIPVGHQLINHFNRKKGVRKTYEEIQVFVRKC